jgi:hypothetical protein
LTGVFLLYAQPEMSWICHRLVALLSSGLSTMLVFQGD